MTVTDQGKDRQVADNDGKVLEAGPLPGFEPPSGMECKRIKTGAEKIFDAGIYGGIGWGGNAALSTAIAYYVQEGKHSKQWIEKIATMINKERPNITRVRNNAEFLSLIIGGTLLMGPVKGLEDHKADIVRNIDTAILKVKNVVGIQETEEERANKKAAFDLLEQEPKQNWGTILRGRFVGLGVALGTLNAVDILSHNKGNMALKNAASDVVGKIVTKTLPGRNLNMGVIDKLTRLATIDVIYSMVAAAGLYVDSHLVNPPKNHRKLQGGTLSPLNPPNEESTWVNHVPASKKGSYQQSVLADKQNQGTALYHN